MSVKLVNNFQNVKCAQQYILYILWAQKLLKLSKWDIILSRQFRCCNIAVRIVICYKMCKMFKNSSHNNNKQELFWNIYQMVNNYN